jgi:hypothetical protein
VTRRQDAAEVEQLVAREDADRALGRHEAGEPRVATMFRRT